MLEVLFGELADVLARVLAKYGEGVGGHCGSESECFTNFSKKLTIQSSGVLVEWVEEMKEMD